MEAAQEDEQTSASWESVKESLIDKMKSIDWPQWKTSSLDPFPLTEHQIGYNIGNYAGAVYQLTAELLEEAYQAGRREGAGK